jgi:hypothetical protein
LNSLRIVYDIAFGECIGCGIEGRIDCMWAKFFMDMTIIQQHHPDIQDFDNCVIVSEHVASHPPIYVETKSFLNITRPHADNSTSILRQSHLHPGQHSGSVPIDTRANDRVTHKLVSIVDDIFMP